MRPTIADLRTNSRTGELPYFGWPGGYPIVYLDSDGSSYCAQCANDQEPDADYPVNSWFIHYEGPSIFCDECSTEIESAYGDPDAEQVDAAPTNWLGTYTRNA